MEYASQLRMSTDQVYKLQKFMYQTDICSLDKPIDEDATGEITLMDTVPSGNGIQEETVNRIVDEYLQTELWESINLVVNKEMAEILVFRYKHGHSLEKTGELMRMTKEQVRYAECRALRRLKHNSKETNGMFCGLN